MSKLTAKGRNALASSQFAQPAKRAFPIPDASHAANAKSRATQQVKAGNLSQSAASQIKAAASKVLARKK